MNKKQRIFWMNIVAHVGSIFIFFIFIVKIFGLCISYIVYPELFEGIHYIFDKYIVIDLAVVLITIIPIQVLRFIMVRLMKNEGNTNNKDIEKNI